jgi:chemotaxis protein MotB
MARKKKHEDHTNHEAWAIPYGDLVTLLLAFFVVMYALSTVNAGKYRVLSDSLQSAFRGTPRTMEPIQIGERTSGTGGEVQIAAPQRAALDVQQRSFLATATNVPVRHGNHSALGAPEGDGSAADGDKKALEQVASQVEQAMQDLIREKLVVVRRTNNWVEVEIRTDILFNSGAASLPAAAMQILNRLADTLKPFPNPIRVEGHTDNVRINTLAFPSNWELSSARAASVVHLFTNRGMNPSRLMVVGYGEQHPAQSNDNADGRNANRRVLLVILGNDQEPAKAVPLPAAATVDADDKTGVVPLAAGPAAIAIPAPSIAAADSSTP